MTIIISD